MRLNFVQWQIQLRNWKIFFPLWKKPKFSKAKLKCCLHLSSSSSSRIPIWGWLKNFGSNFALTYTHLEILHQPQSCGACLEKATGFVERKTCWILVFAGTAVTPLHVTLPLSLLGEQGRRKVTENKNTLPHMRCVSTKTQGWSRLLALTTLMLEYSHLANFAITLHLWEPAFGEALRMPWMPPLTGSLPDWDPASLTSHGRQESTAVSLHGAGKHRQPQLCRGSPPIASLGTIQAWGEAARTHSSCWQALWVFSRSFLSLLIKSSPFRLFLHQMILRPVPTRTQVLLQFLSNGEFVWQNCCSIDFCEHVGGTRASSLQTPRRSQLIRPLAPPVFP